MAIPITCPPSELMRPKDAHWSLFEFDLLQTLATRLRMLATPQIASVWGMQPEEVACRVEPLVTSGLLEMYTINAHPRLQPARPVFGWQPGTPAPDVDITSRAVKSRWCSPSVPTGIVIASKKTANLFGADCHGLPKVEERDHDLLLADAFVAHRTSRRSSALRWIGEDFLPKAGYKIKDPDAFLLGNDGEPIGVIESGGRYGSKQIASFHDYCESLALPYELW